MTIQTYHYTDAEIAEPEFTSADAAKVVLGLALGTVALTAFIAAATLGGALGAILFGVNL